MGKITKILIIDDNADIRQAVRLTVEEQEHFTVTVTESSDVESGIEQLEKIHPDIVILDLHMPNQSGFDFMTVLRKSEKYANVKVIMMTADDTIDNVLEAEDRGVNPYYFLGKPFNVVDLRALVLSLILPLKPL